MTSPSATAATHPCARCGAPVPLDVGLCERCNPLGLRDAASSQVHGTVFVAIVVAVLGLSIVARFAVAGIGPFRAEVVSVAPAAAGLAITLEVTNDGSAMGSTTCRIAAPGRTSTGRAHLALSPRIGPGETLTWTVTTDAFGTEPVALRATCSAP